MVKLLTPEELEEYFKTHPLAKEEWDDLQRRAQEEKEWEKIPPGKKPLTFEELCKWLPRKKRERDAAKEAAKKEETKKMEEEKNEKKED